MIPDSASGVSRDLLLAELIDQAVRDAKDAAVPAYVFAQDDDPVVFLHLLLRARLRACTIVILAIAPLLLVAGQFLSQFLFLGGQMGQHFLVHMIKHDQRVG